MISWYMTASWFHLLTWLFTFQYQQEEVFVKFLGWFDDANTVFLAMEYFPYGDLNKYITDSITENDAIQITTDLLEGLKIMHAEGFAHRDLKPQVCFLISAHELKFTEE
jgi:serine/threonine protein kinase